jgi:lipopolysaccharide transport system permease protein
MVTSREIMIRYKQSIMGLFWALLMPAMVIAAGMLVRIAAARLSGQPLAATAITAVVVKSLPWAFFISAISLTANSNLVTRARCPRFVFPFSAILCSLFDFAIALIVVVVVLASVGIPITLQLLWVIPLLLLLVAFTLGLGLGLATANLFYRDVKYIVEVVLTFAIFFSPVLYETSMLGSWGPIVMLNPVAPLLEGIYSAVALGVQPDLRWVAYSAVLTAVTCLLSWLFFRKLEPAFADRI